MVAIGPFLTGTLRNMRSTDVDGGSPGECGVGAGATIDETEATP